MSRLLDGGVFELAYAELRVEDEWVEGTLLFLDSLEESEVRKLARDFLRKSLRNAMVTLVISQLFSFGTSTTRLHGDHDVHRSV